MECVLAKHTLANKEQELETINDVLAAVIPFKAAFSNNYVIYFSHCTPSALIIQFIWKFLGLRRILPWCTWCGLLSC